MLSGQWAGATSQVRIPETPGEGGKRVPRFGPTGNQGHSSGMGKGMRREEKGSCVRTWPGPEQPPRRHPPWRGSVGARGAASQPARTPGGPPRHGGCAPGSTGGGGAEGAGSPAAPSPGLFPSPLPGPAAPPLTCLPGFGAHRRSRTRRPQAALNHDGCSACLFKSGSLSELQRAGAKVPAVAGPRVAATPAPPPPPPATWAVVGFEVVRPWAWCRRMGLLPDPRWLPRNAEVRGRGGAQRRSPAETSQHCLICS